MAEVITQFKLETTQFDSKLRDAAQGLKSVVNVANNAGKSFTGFSQNAIAAARSLGQIESGANNAKDRVKDLVGSFNDAAKAYNKLTEEQRNSDFGKALSASLQQLQQRIRETKQEMQSLGDSTKGMGGLFGGDKLSGMLQVFGGNVMTKLASAGMSLVGEIGDAIQASSQLAREAEGVRIAFDRLDDPTLLDALKEATHGTVSEFELMKAAVKFNDFKLPLEELGTMLAFAQQKAKDTGQSVDYMVDSIVTGLGRKSLMILDNLGLSAAEIKERMKETGDMTKAVGAIIRDQMSKAGDYVETAADRANRANAELENKMRVLGEVMHDTFGISGISDFATAIKTELVGSLLFTIETINEAKKKFNELMQLMGIQDKPKKQGSSQPSSYPDGTYWETTDSEGRVTASGRWLNGKRVQTGAGDVVVTGNKPDPKKKKTKTTTTSHTETPQEKAQKRMSDAQHKYAVALEKAQAEFDGGNITEKDLKTAQKRAAESLFEAADDAYRTYADPQYKTVREDAKQKFVNLGGEVKTLTEIEKANQKTAREQEQAQKKLSDALRKQADALERGNLKDYNAATKQVREAEKEVARLGGSAAFENVEHGDINIPVGLKFDDSALKSFTEQVDQKLGTSPIPFQFALNQENVAAVIENLKEQLSRADVGSELFNSLLEKLGNAQLISDSINKGISDNIDGKTGKKRKKDGDSPMDKASKALGGLNSIAGGLEKMGVELPSEVQNLIGVIEGAMAIIQGVQAIIAITQTTALTANTVALGALTAAMWANVTTNWIPFMKTGGIAHAAQGFVPGNNYSDNVPLMVSSGELILNRAQQGNLASQLEGGAGLGELNLSAVIRGEQIRLVLNNNGRRTGRGEYVQSKSVK